MVRSLPFLQVRQEPWEGVEQGVMGSDVHLRKLTVGAL